MKYFDIEERVLEILDDANYDIWSEDGLMALFDAFIDNVYSINPFMKEMRISIDDKWKNAAIFYVVAHSYIRQSDDESNMAKGQAYMQLYTAEMANLSLRRQ